MRTTMFDAMAKAEEKKVAELADKLNMSTMEVCKHLTAEIVGAKKYKASFGNTVLEHIPGAIEKGYGGSTWQLAKYIASQLHIPETTVNLRVKKYMGDGKILQVIKAELVSAESENRTGLEGMVRFSPGDIVVQNLADPPEDGDGGGTEGGERAVEVKIDDQSLDASGSINKRVVITLTLDINVEVI